MFSGGHTINAHWLFSLIVSDTGKSSSQGHQCTIGSKINDTPKGGRLSEKLQLTAALCNEIWLQ